MIRSDELAYYYYSSFVVISLVSRPRNNHTLMCSSFECVMVGCASTNLELGIRDGLKIITQNCKIMSPHS